jgi:hypothetical protein
VDGQEGAKAPDHVPDEWLVRYGTPDASETSGDRTWGDEKALTQLTSWIAVITGIGAVVAWLLAGVPGMVALIVPVVVICAAAVLVAHWMIRSDRRERERDGG